LASNGTWAPRDHFVKNHEDIDIIRLIGSLTKYNPRFDRVEAVINEIGERGIGDNVIFYSPFGKLVH